MGRSSNQVRRCAYHHGDLMRAIRDSALKFIAIRGTAEFTMRELASNIGVTHGAIYSHFKNKQALLEDLTLTNLRVLHERQQKSIEGCQHGLEVLERLALAYTDFALSQPGAYRLIFNINDLSSESPATAMQRKTAASLTVKAIGDAQQKKLIVSGSNDVLAFTLWSAIHGLSHLLLSEHVGQFELAARDIDYTIHYAIHRHLCGVATTQGRTWLAGRIELQTAL